MTKRISPDLTANERNKTREEKPKFYIEENPLITNKFKLLKLVSDKVTSLTVLRIFKYCT